jgi:hypothetical protein
MKKELELWEQALFDAERKGYGQTKLIVDGINVTYEFGRSDGNRLLFVFFVDGTWSGEYSSKDSDYGKRFGRAMTSRISPKMEKKLKTWRYTKAEIATKKEAAKLPFAYSPCHRSAKSVIAVLKKNNQVIALMDKEVET